MKIDKDEYGDDKLIIENYDDFVTFTEALEQLKKKAVPIMNAYLELDGQKPRYPIDEDEISFEDGYIYANWTEYVCGSDDHYSASIPADYLFDEEWMEDAKKRIEVKREKERLAKEKRERESKERARKAEYERYLELQKKFGGAENV